MLQSYYFYSNGELKRRDNTLKFTDFEGKQRDLPIERISEIYVMSEMDLNTNLLNFISQYGVIMHFFNYYSFYTGSFYPKEALLAGDLLVHQVEHYIDYNKRLNLAKKIIIAASNNIYRNLRYYNGRGKNIQNYMDQISNISKNIDSSKCIQELMGYEGNIRKIYYESWNVIVDRDINFEKRVIHASAR